MSSCLDYDTLPLFIKAVENSKYHTHRAWWVILFGWRGTVFPRLIFRIILLIMVSVALNLLRMYEYWFPILNPTAHTLVGIGLGLLLVYRTNASYDRYWEGRKLWYVVLDCVVHRAIY